MEKEKIKAEELRIGNLYDQFGNVAQVCWATLKTLSESPENQVWCKPIRLTEEWLIKFGFEKEINKEDFDYWFRDDFDNDILWEHSEGFCHNLNRGGEVKYVHQLMNLYFALTGEELTPKE